MRVALLTYSTRPRGGVVHTLALAEALAALGEEVHVWTLGRGGDRTFFRPVDPAVTVHAVPFDSPDPDVGRRIVRSIEVLRAAFEPHRASYDVVHAQDCISANAALPRTSAEHCVRTIHHLDTDRGQRLGQRERVHHAAAGAGGVGEQRDPHELVR